MNLGLKDLWLWILKLEIVGVITGISFQRLKEKKWQIKLNKNF